MLLQIGAEIEHALMVEYLYAAYSLGGSQVPSRQPASSSATGARASSPSRRRRWAIS